MEQTTGKHAKWPTRIDGLWQIRYRKTSWDMDRRVQVARFSMASRDSTHQVSRSALQAALEQFDRQGVVELALIFGNDSLLAALINAFDTDLPPDRTERHLPI